MTETADTAKPSEMTDRAQPPRATFIVTAVLALVILIPSMLGFINKFQELVRLCRGEVDGAFAITPVVNYLLASLGFFCLLCWAAINGMFHDIEAPKRAMLDTERKLDSRSGVQSSRSAFDG